MEDNFTEQNILKNTIKRFLKIFYYDGSSQKTDCLILIMILEKVFNFQFLYIANYLDRIIWISISKSFNKSLKLTLNKEKTILFKKINKIFTECNIKFILFNRSLLYAEKLNLLSPDFKDDLITDLPIKDRKKLIESLRRFYKIKISKDKIEFNAKKIKINIYFFNSKDIYFCFKGFLIKTELFKNLIKYLSKN